MAGTRWVKIDTSYLENPKISGLHPTARLLHLASILWSAEQLTDGHIPTRALHALGHRADIDPRWLRRRAQSLVEANLWEPNGDGWHIHDFEAMNPQAMRHKVEAERRKWQARQAAHRNGVTGGVTP